MSRILVVEDEESFVDALTVGLEREGFSVDIARNGAEALDRFKTNKPDLVLLDMMLPIISGLDVCTEIRRSSDVPIIIVSAKSSELDTVVGLEVGADDYVTKPYRMRELVARIRAVLRRRNLDAAGIDASPAGYNDRDVLTVGGLKIDFDSREVFVDGVLVELPRKEFDLLGYLMENAGRVLERASIINTVWGLDYVGDTKTLDVHIKRLRAKIEIDPSEPSRLVTVRGVGYKLYDPA